MIPGPPEPLWWTTYLLVGTQWPPENEDGFTKIAPWVGGTLPSKLRELAEELARTRAKVAAAGLGPAATAALDYMDGLVNKADALLREQLYEDLKNTADAADKIAMQVEYTKITIIIMAAMLLYMFLKLL